jgi:hypothetical protein
MNLTTIANIPSKNIKRIRGQYVAAVAVVALAVSAVVAFGPSTTTAPKLVAQTRQALSADIAASALSTELANYPAPSVAPKASDADVLASALSGEMATFDFSATPPVQRQAAEADIAASVLSTELAHFGSVDPARHDTLVLTSPR